MWCPVLLCLLVGTATAGQHAWKNGKEYTYHLHGRTLAALHEVADQYTGVVFKSQLKCQQKNEETLNCRVQKPRVADFHGHLPGGWDSPLPEDKMDYQRSQLTDKPFELKIKNGVITELIVEKSTPNWQVNMIKAIASQLQVDANGENMIESHYNQEPEDDSPNAVFKTMEDTVSGKCEVLYDISPLPEYMLQSEPQLAPQPQLKEEGDYIDIVKTSNFSHCYQRRAFEYGIPATNDWQAGSNDMGRFISRSSVSRIIVSGSLRSYTIQSSVTINRIMASPTLHESQKGMVVSKLNITLNSVASAPSKPSPPSNPQSIGNLVYSYDYQLSGNDKHRPHHYKGEDSSSSGSSSSSSEEQHQYAFDASSVSSSDSSEEESWSSNTNLEDAPRNPYTIHFEGYADGVNRVAVAKKLSNQIGQELQHPSKIPKELTLAKFSLLVTTVQTMNLKQIHEAAQELYFLDSKSSTESARNSAWKAFRDAVAQAGTGPALLVIKDWIMNKKVQGEEAAELVAVLPSRVVEPTPQYIDAFFTMATESEVTEQAYLNSTAIIAFTNFLGEAEMNNASAYNRHPVQSSGSLSSNPAVKDKYIPYIAQKLKNAIQQADSPKIQVYIHALGNVGDPKMLSVLEPYLEGQEKTSDFQRLMMIASMNKLIERDPKLARTFLFKVYQNTGETYPVRCVAIFQLMRTNPPASMLQRMAEFTNKDVSNQVNAAVKSAIEAAAELQNYDQAELAHNARAARDLLTSKTFGFQYSHTWLRDYAVKELNLAYEINAVQIGSEDSIIPQAMYAMLNRNKGGFNMPPLEMGYMVSSIDNVFNVLSEQYGSKEEQRNNRNNNSKNSSKFSAQRIAEMLNIQTDGAKQLEGNVLISMLQSKRLMAFDNHTIEQLPKIIQKAASSLEQGQSFNHAKFYSGTEFFVGLVTATGMPFYYHMRTPSLVKICGEAQAKTEPKLSTGSSDDITIPKIINVTADIHSIFSTKLQASIAFFNPANHKYYSAGVDKNFQVNLPLRTKVDVDLKNSQVRVKLQTIQPNKDYNLIHYSTWPYTTQHDVRNMNPVAQDKETRRIYINDLEQVEFILGQKNTGIAIRVEAHTDDLDRKSAWSLVYEMLKPHDNLSPLIFPMAQASIRHNNFNVIYDSRHSTNNALVLTWTYDNIIGSPDASGPSWKHPAARNSRASKEDEANDPIEIREYFGQQSGYQNRREQFLSEAAGAVYDGSSSVVDFSAEFQGQNKAQYAMTVALGSSKIDDKGIVLFYYNQKPASGKNYEVCFAGKGKYPNVPVMNFVQALKADPTGNVEAYLLFGEECQSGGKVILKGKMRQSRERREYLSQRPMARQCVEQMEQGNNILPACRNVSARSNFFDEGRLLVRYTGIPDQLKNFTAEAYRLARYFAYTNAYENFGNTKNQEKGRIDFAFEFSPGMQYLNVSMNAPEMNANLTNVRVHPWVRPLVALDPVQSIARRFGRKAFAGQYNPTCVLDNNMVSTFDNKTYPVELGKCWHVVAATISNSNVDEPSENPSVSIVSRDVNDNQREYKIILGETEIQLQPGSGKPKALVNGKEIKLSKKRIYRHEEQGQQKFELYAMPDSFAALDSVEYNLKVRYDGVRAKMVFSNQYRNQIRGLCGTFSGEQSTDFTSPDNCILKNPEEFAATWALTDQAQCQGPAKEIAERAKNAHCYRQSVLFGNVVSDQEASRPKSKASQFGNKHVRSGKNNKNQETNCSQYKVVVSMEDEQVCFSLMPVPVCAPGCKANNNQQRNVPMHCIENSKHARFLAQRVKMGVNPDFSKKQQSKSIRMAIPESCGEQ